MLNFIRILAVATCVLASASAQACVDDDAKLRAAMQVQFSQFAQYVQTCSDLPGLANMGLEGGGCNNQRTLQIANAYCPVTCGTCAGSSSGESPASAPEERSGNSSYIQIYTGDCTGIGGVIGK